MAGLGSPLSSASRQRQQLTVVVKFNENLQLVGAAAKIIKISGNGLGEKLNCQLILKKLGLAVKNQIW